MSLDKYVENVDGIIICDTKYVKDSAKKEPHQDCPTCDGFNEGCIYYKPLNLDSELQE